MATLKTQTVAVIEVNCTYVRAYLPITQVESYTTEATAKYVCTYVRTYVTIYIRTYIHRFQCTATLGRIFGMHTHNIRTYIGTCVCTYVYKFCTYVHILYTYTSHMYVHMHVSR